MTNGAAGRGERVLVVDDNLQNRLVAEGHLVADGYTVSLAEDGAQALELFDSEHPDLVLLDILMPGMDGFEVCWRLRETVEGKATPILFLTALGDLETHKRALASGADDFLAKPIQRVELLLRVRSLVRIKRLQTGLERSNALIRSQRDALLRAQEEKRRLTAMIVHDLKSPLAALMGNGHYVLDGAGLDGDLRDAMQDIVRSTDGMHRMVMDLLDVAQSEDGALVPKCSAVDVAALVEGCRVSFRGRTYQTQLQLGFDVPDNAVSVLADKDLIERVIDNLLDNASKYAPAESEIRVEVQRQDGRVLFSVQDRGPGVPEKHRKMIFEQYAQINDGEHAPVRTSRGLGLAFCRLAVEAHGGEIWVEERPGGGSSFSFWIPTGEGALK